MIEQLVARERMERPGSQFYFYRTQIGSEVDLVIDRGQTRHGYEFKCALAVGPEDVAHLKGAIADGVIADGKVIYLGRRSFLIADKIHVVSAEDFLAAEA